jgi:signal transduction histidine kinase/CheY-like chemotaxis protein
MTDASEQILILTPRGRDADRTIDVLAAAGLVGVRCTSAVELVAGIRGGAGCAIVTGEALSPELQEELRVLLDEQPPWSDFPIVVLSTGSVAPALDLGNMTILERPIAPVTLLATVRSALRGRRRQYEARAAIQQRDQFLAMLGHELRNPLAAITLASDAIDLSDRARLEKRLAVIARQAKHLTRLVNDLLDVARVTSGKLQLQRGAVDIDTTIRNCVEALESRATEHQIELILDLDCGALIDGDGGRLEQVIGNLVTNAIKYSGSGKQVVITSRRFDDSCEIRVLDQGVGIAPEMLPRVFELFAQADASLARSDGGLGVGLALVERLVRLHGGSVAVTSAGLGTGSEFVVRLPIGAVRLEQAAPQVTSGTAQRPLRVVIVEDNPDLLALTAAVIEALGCSTETAGDGEAGLELIERSLPDLALVDVGLPKLDGYGVASALRDRQLPTMLVAVTGYGQRSDRERALASGFHEHVIKPVRAKTLQDLIDSTRQRLLHASVQARRGA